MSSSAESEAADVFAAILDPSRRGDLYSHYHRLRALAPVHEDETLLGRRAWILTRFADADRVHTMLYSLQPSTEGELWSLQAPSGSGGAFYDSEGNLIDEDEPTPVSYTHLRAHET